MTATNKQILYVASKGQLLHCKDCYLHLWITIVSLTHLSSARLIEAIEEFLRDLDDLKIEIRYLNGDLYPIPYMFDVFPIDDDDKENDPGTRWVSNFKRANKQGTGPRMFCTKPASLPRLELLELFAHATVAKYTRGPDTPRCSLTHLPLGW